MKLQFCRADVDDIEVVDEDGMFDGFIVDFGLGQPADMAEVKPIGPFADGRRGLPDPQTFNDDVAFGVFSNAGDPSAQIDFTVPAG